MLGYNTVIRQT